MRKLNVIAAAGVALALGCARANAQSQTFGTGIGTYTLLNGDNLSLYVDELGDFGAPRYSSGTVKPGGVLNSSNQVEVNSDGSVVTTAGNIGYGMLYSPTTTAGQATVGASVQAKNEYISLGTVATQEGWGVEIGSTFHAYSSATFDSMSISGNSATGLLSETSTLNLSTLGISQVTSFNGAGTKNIAQITTTFTNNGSSNLTGLDYVRYINPNQDEGPGGSSSVQTNQSFGTTGLPGAFAINSTGTTSGRQLALGVQYTDPNSGGSKIFAISGTTSEANALTNPNGQLANANYIQLDSGDEGATYVNRTNSALDATTANYALYLSSNGALDPFVTSGGSVVTPSFSTQSSDTDLELESGLLGDGNGVAGELTPGSSVSYTFYYIFPLPTSSAQTSVPEPGLAALFASSSIGAAWRIRKKLRG